ncbi:hypothetical protein, partial [Erwinia amylovora]|uniref:hypothetical protein n=1 Tax=Erwinia amylovora TaxID=552 RepID=UPI0020BFC3E2
MMSMGIWMRANYKGVSSYFLMVFPKQDIDGLGGGICLPGSCTVRVYRAFRFVIGYDCLLKEILLA